MTSRSATSQARHRHVAPLSFFPAGGWPGKRAGRAPMAWRCPPGRSPAPVGAMSPPRTRVLLIADRASIALDLQRALREAGYQIVGPATCVEQARRLLARCAIDCAIVDLDAHVSAAAEVLDRWGTPFVILTSRMDPPEAHAGRPRLHKPFGREDVASAVERAIARHAGDGDDGGGIQYRVEPSTVSWPRVLPQL